MDNPYKNPDVVDRHDAIKHACDQPHGDWINEAACDIAKEWDDITASAGEAAQLAEDDEADTMVKRDRVAAVINKHFNALCEREAKWYRKGQ